MGHYQLWFGRIEVRTVNCRQLTLKRNHREMDTVGPILQTGINYVKQLNPMNSSFLRSVPGVSYVLGPEEAFDDPSGDVSGNILGNLPIDTSTNNAAPSGSVIDLINAAIADPSTTNILNMVLALLYYMMIILLGSFIANDLIFAHWTVRLFSFSFFMFLAINTGIAVVPVAAYYIISALYYAYLNFRDNPAIKHPLIPPHYAMLPLMTSRGNRFDFLNPFCYFKRGDDMKDPAYYFYKRDETERKAFLDSLIPNLQGLKQNATYKFSELNQKFNTFYKALNEPFLKTGLTNDDKKKKDAETETANIEQQLMGAILKTTGTRAKTYIKSIGNPTGPTGSVEKPGIIANTISAAKLAIASISPTGSIGSTTGPTGTIESPETGASV